MTEESPVSIAELKSDLPAPGELGLKQQQEYEWDNATDLLVQGLVIPAATTPSSWAPRSKVPGSNVPLAANSRTRGPS